MVSRNTKTAPTIPIGIPYAIGTVPRIKIIPCSPDSTKKIPIIIIDKSPTTKRPTPFNKISQEMRENSGFFLASIKPAVKRIAHKRMPGIGKTPIRKTDSKKDVFQKREKKKTAGKKEIRNKSRPINPP